MSWSSYIYEEQLQLPNEIVSSAVKRVTSARTNRVKGCGHVTHWYKKNRTTVKVSQDASSTLLHFAGLRDLELQQRL
jgi:hypothetical protein